MNSDVKINYKKMATYIDTNYPKFIDNFNIFNKENSVHFDICEFALIYYPNIYSEYNFDAMEMFSSFEYLCNTTNFLDYLNGAHTMTEALEKASKEINLYDVETKFGDGHIGSFISSYKENVVLNGFENICKEKDKNCMKYFYLFDSNSLANILYDFDLKKESLYKAILSDNLFPELIKNASKDYIDTLTSIFNGEYSFGKTKISLLEAAKYDIAKKTTKTPKIGIFKYVDFGDEIGVDDPNPTLLGIFDIAISTPSIFIVYNYWRYTKNSEIFNLFIKLLSMRINHICLENSFNCGEEHIVEIKEIVDFYSFEDFNNSNSKQIIEKMINCVIEYHLRTKELIENKDLEIRQLIESYDEDFVNVIIKQNEMPKDYKLSNRVVGTNGSSVGHISGLKEFKSKDYKEFAKKDWSCNLLYYLSDIEESNYGIADDKFINNKSFDRFKTYLTDEPIYYNRKGIMNNLPNDMNFDIYSNILEMSRFSSKLSSLYDDIGTYLANLGLCSEQLSLLNYVINRTNDEKLLCFDIDEIVLKINKTVYSSINAKHFSECINELSLDSLEHNEAIKEIDLYSRTVYLINDMLKDFHTTNDIENLLKEKTAIIEDMVHFGINENTIGVIENISNIIIEKLVNICNGDSKYSTVFNDVSNKISSLKKSIKNSISNYECFDENEFETEFSKVETYIATAELLYDSYINDNEDKNLDYGGMALAYYKALECLVNIVVYKPYYLNVLSNRKPQNFKEEIEYCGTKENYFKMTRKKGSKYLYRDSLEYGNLAYLFTYVSNSKSYKYLYDYLIKNNFDIAEVHKFFNDMLSTTSLRNECAHPEITNSDCMKKARIITFDDTEEFNFEDGDVVANIYKLIFRLPKLFINEKETDNE